MLFTESPARPLAAVSEAREAVDQGLDLLVQIHHRLPYLDPIEIAEFSRAVRRLGCIHTALRKRLATERRRWRDTTSSQPSAQHREPVQLEFPF